MMLLELRSRDGPPDFPNLTSIFAGFRYIAMKEKKICGGLTVRKGGTWHSCSAS